MAENGRLFAAGFGSSMLFGLVAGPAIDKHGRRAGCLAYGLLYTLSCAVKHSSSFSVLMVGRVLGGAATSILYSAFESWMVAEHAAKAFDPALLASTFSRMCVVLLLLLVLIRFVRSVFIPCVYLANSQTRTHLYLIN